MISVKIRNSLRLKILFPMIVMICVTVLIVEALTFYFTSQKILSHIEESEIQYALDAKNKIQNLSRIVDQNIIFLAQLPVILNYVANLKLDYEDDADENKQDIELTMLRIKQRDENYLKVSFIDANGLEKISLLHGKVRTTTRNVSADALVQETIKTGRVTISKLPESLEGDANFKVLRWLKPIADRKGLIGIIEMDYNFAAVVNILENVKLQDNGFMFLATVNGTVLHHPLLKSTQNSHAKWGKSLTPRFSTNSTGTIYHREVDDSYVTGFAKIDSLHWNKDAVALPEPWIVAVSVPRFEILKGLIWLAIGIFFMAFIMAILAIFITNWSIKKIVINPINDLKNVVCKIVTEENFQQQVTIVDADEVGILGSSFNTMLDALTQRDLEISRKMLDLETLNNTGQALAGLFEQTKALETVLQVLKKKTNVDSGSVYLLNKDAMELEIKAYYPQRKTQPERAPSTFKLGEGIAGKAAQQKKLIYIPDTSKNELFIDYGLDRAKALLSIPLIDDQEIIGVMNFSGQVGLIKFTESDEIFAETIARMTVVTTKNIQMVNVIEDYNRTLEQKVTERTEQLLAKTNDISNMLENMHQGIFTVIENLKVHPEYSAYLENILETKEIANTDVVELMFADSNLGPDQTSQIEAALDAFGDNAFVFKSNQRLLIKEFNKTMADGRKKILEVDWDPIINADDELDKVMVTLRDVTELKVLQAEAQQQKKELGMIGQILATSPNEFREFLQMAENYLCKNKQLIESTVEKDNDVLAVLFRNMHTIKGNARTHGLTFCTDIVHQIEHSYDDLRSNDAAVWNQKDMLDDLQLAQQSVNAYAIIYKDKLECFFKEQTSEILTDNALLDKVRQIAEVGKRNIANESLQQELQQILIALDTVPLSQIVQGSIASLPNIALQMGKEVPRIEIDDHNIRLSKSVSGVLKDVFMHLLRNSVAHGLESAKERTQKGKPTNGTIRLHAAQSSSKVILTLSDDGRGLNLERLRQKAVENSLVDTTKTLLDEEAANLIFYSGISTAEQVSDISGRGVGMDAVRKFLQEHDGDVILKLISGGTPTSWPFELQVTLPANKSMKL